MVEETSTTNDWVSRENIEASIDQARSTLDEVDQQVRSFVRERPFAAVGAAVVAGFLLGRLLSR